MLRKPTLLKGITHHRPKLQGSITVQSSYAPSNTNMVINNMTIGNNINKSRSRSINTGIHASIRSLLHQQVLKQQFNINIQQQSISHLHTSIRSIMTSSRSIIQTQRKYPSLQISPYTIQQRGFRFQRFFVAPWWSPYKSFVDILSPLRTITNFLMLYRYRIYRFAPGKIFHFFGVFVAYWIMSTIVVRLIERDRQFDTGWDDPEMANKGYIYRGDRVESGGRHEVEIYRKQTNFRTKDGKNETTALWARHQKVRTQKWQFVRPDRFKNQHKTLWPIRNIDYASPIVYDRPYRGSVGDQHTRKRFVYKYRPRINRKREFRVRRGRRKRAWRMSSPKINRRFGAANPYFHRELNQRDKYIAHTPHDTKPVTYLPDAQSY